MSADKNKIIGGASAIIHSLAVPLFFLFFIIFYKPHAIYGLLDMEHAGFTFNATILFCIILLSTAITRSILYLIGRYKNISTQLYSAWCLAEMIVSALFSSLYVTLMLNGSISFFEVAGSIIIMVMSTAIYPYAFIWFKYEIYEKNQEIHETPDENSLIRFYDEYKKLRLVMAREAILFIKSEENYVNIYYLDKGKNKKFTLRSSMKALEDTLAKHGLVRCHRSYFINPAYIKIVHRNSAGMIVAELNQPDCDSIPISRKYQDIITRLI
ncbi:MAG: LytTR family transcriptional regulator [Bacteroidaceae bacterium]|nr:LytTR family transcriptional regulator [Bacteroidaceae bacterium]